jgi:hypothetical protein
MTDYSKVDLKTAVEFHDPPDRLNVYGIKDRMQSGTMHPDGEPWKKCCKPNGPDCDFLADAGCAAVRKCFYDKEAHLTSADLPFVCLHRKTEDGHFRVCAGWDALWQGKTELPK